MKRFLEFLRFRKETSKDKVQLAYEVCIRVRHASPYYVFARTTTSVDEDLYVEFRGTKNHWFFKILLKAHSSVPQYYFANPPEIIRYVLCDLTFEETARLTHHLNSQGDPDIEIPEWLVLAPASIPKNHEGPPRVS